MSAAGSWSPLELAELFRCRCGKEIVGKVGPRGGRTWIWRLSDGTLVCSDRCPSIAQDEADRINDEMRGEQQADAAMRDYLDRDIP